jgi:hypothetical protein
MGRSTEYLGLEPKDTLNLLAKGNLPARKVGKRWVATRTELQKLFGIIAA